MPHPRISIVLPTYNGARFLAQSIESVLAQHFTAWELIVVDDCSTDDTPAIIADYAARDPRIRGIRHEHNKKLPGALNTGFAAAQGQLFTWTSDDNLYRPQALETMLRYLDEQPQIDLVYSDYMLINDAGAELRRVPALPPAWLVEKSTVGACFLYRRNLHDALGGYDEQRFLIEDYDFWLRASMQFRFAALAEDLYCYRHHEGSLTAQKRARVLALREEMLAQHVPHLGWASPGDRARAYLHLRDLAHENGSPERARRYTWQALQAQPILTGRRLLLAALPTGLRNQLTRLYQKRMLGR